MELHRSLPFLVSAAVCLLLCARIPSACCQRLSSGPCKDILGMTPFNLTQFLGDWYEVERSFYIVESALRCTRVNFTLSEEFNKINVNVTYKLPWREELSSAIYWADFIGEGQSVLELILRDVPGYLSRLAPGSGTYTILDTDYTDYALIYSCTSFRFFHADFVWVLGRRDDISAKMRSRVYSALDSLSIPRERLLLTKQNC